MYRVFLGLLALFLAMVPGWGASGEPITIRDISGRVVEVPRSPDRILCLGPGTLRMIVYLQAWDRVVAVEDMEKLNPRGRPYWLAHPGLHDLPSAGPGGPASINQKPNLELVLSLNPQVIFITYMDASLAHEVHRILNIPVIVLGYGPFANFDDTFFDSLALLGLILGREDRAEAVSDFIRSAQEDIRARSRQSEGGVKPRVYIGGIGHRGARGLESTERHYPPFDWTLAHNVAAEMGSINKGHLMTGMEVLLAVDPDIIFMDAGGLRLVQQAYERHPQAHDALLAFKNRQVYVLHPFNWYLTNIGTALIDAYTVGKILYPDFFHDVVLAEKADEIYEFLVGTPVHREMEKDYGLIGALPQFLPRED